MKIKKNFEIKASDIEIMQLKQLTAYVSGLEKFNSKLQETQERRRSWIILFQDVYFKFVPARLQQVTQKILLLSPRVAYRVLKLSGVHHQQF